MREMIWRAALFALAVAVGMVSWYSKPVAAARPHAGTIEPPVVSRSTGFSAASRLGRGTGPSGLIRRLMLWRELPNTPKRRPRILYFNRHHGTSQDFAYVADELNLQWELVNPVFSACTGHTYYIKDNHNRTVYDSMTEGQSDVCWQMFGAMLCYGCDVIVVGDIIPYARMFLRHCDKPIILQMTQRFDQGIDSDDTNYYKLMQLAAGRENVMWVANNPYEREYARISGLTVPESRYWLIRPVGFSDLPGIAVPPENRTKIVEVSRRYEHKHILEPVLDKLEIPHVKWIDHHHGGPITISRFAAIVHIPYQTSIMSMYENLAYGSAYLVPTPRFYRKLQTNRFWREHVFKWFPDHWTQVCEWWHKDFQDVMMYFDSWEDLQAQVTAPNFLSVAAVYKKKSTDRMDSIRKLSIATWAEVFSKVGVKISAEMHGRPLSTASEQQDLSKQDGTTSLGQGAQHERSTFKEDTNTDPDISVDD